jgi:hypothetical protein
MVGFLIGLGCFVLFGSCCMKLRELLASGNPLGLSKSVHMFGFKPQPQIANSSETVVLTVCSYLIHLDISSARF